METNLAKSLMQIVVTVGMRDLGTRDIQPDAIPEEPVN